MLGDPVNLVDPEGLAGVTTPYLSGGFVTHNGNYTCRDCGYGSAIALTGLACMVGPEVVPMIMAMSPETIATSEMVGDMIYSGLSPEPPTTPTQAIGATMKKIIDNSIGN